MLVGSADILIVMFLCVSQASNRGSRRSAKMLEMFHQPFLLGRFVEDLDIEGPVATGGAAARDCRSSSASLRKGLRVPVSQPQSRPRMPTSDVFPCSGCFPSFEEVTFVGVPFEDLPAVLASVGSWS